MRGKSKLRKRYIIILVVLLSFIYYGFFVLGGYSWSENDAIRNSLPNKDGKVVFEKSFGDKKVVILDTGKQCEERLHFFC